MKEKTLLIMAAGVMTLGCGLLVASLIIPPPGEIHNSVLIAFGETCTFAGALFGIKINMKGNEKD